MRSSTTSQKHLISQVSAVEKENERLLDEVTALEDEVAGWKDAIDRAENTGWGKVGLNEYTIQVDVQPIRPIENITLDYTMIEDGNLQFKKDTE